MRQSSGSENVYKRNSEPLILMQDKEKAREELRKLVEKYHRQKSEIANEEQVCQSLVLPLFSKVLGWDTENPSEFKAQDSQKTGKRTDYTVRLGGISQFVVEVKDLRQEIRQNYQYYQQAINYAKYKEKLFAILTNFQHFIILRADIEDQPLQCEVKVINLEKSVDSEADFDILWNFQKEVWTAEKGEGLQKFLRAGKKSVPVSKDLVVEMSKWRLALLNSLARHPRINELDFAKERSYIEQEVQRFIDRLIFICFCEDKELKDKELKNILEIKEAKYSGRDEFLVNEVKELFKDYRRQYDSDLFFEQGYCDKFRFEDVVLAGIIKDLRKPHKRLPYNFADIEADVLGKAYENFIGHVITGEKRFREKESISKRKEEGAYYTPQYIVNYIVDNTLREHIKENKISNFDDILKIKVLDPACGSGTFLIRAFEVLEEEVHRILGRELSYNEKVKLVTSCIFGVDKDERAVDIAKLRLSLALAAREKLPMLNRNIQCGDSLIDDYAIAHEKAFKWEERFKDIMQNGGFDIVVGNPPYINNRNLPIKDKKFFESQYSAAYQQYDIYVLFYERSLHLLKAKGYLGFITPNKFAITNYGLPLRKLFLSNRIAKIVDVSQLNVFGDASTYPYIVIIQKANYTDNIVAFYTPASSNLHESVRTEVKQKALQPEKPFVFWKDVKISTILQKIVGEYLLDVYRAKPTSANIKERGNCVAISNKEIERYFILKSSKRIVRKKEWEIKLPVILMKKICFVPTASLIYSPNLIPVNTVYVINSKDDKIKLKYLLAILNSKLIGFYARKLYGTTAMRGGFIELRAFEIEKIPIKRISESNQKPFVSLVDKMLSLHRRLNEFGDKHTVERERIEEEIRKTDAEIDELVYQIYGITYEEKRIIEESLK